MRAVALLLLLASCGGVALEPVRCCVGATAEDVGPEHRICVYDEPLAGGLFCVSAFLVDEDCARVAAEWALCPIGGAR